MDNRSEATRPTLGHAALAVILVGIAIAAILLIAMRERGTMVPQETAPETRPEISPDLREDIPPIDANAPTETKTATFAMG